MIQNGSPQDFVHAQYQARSTLKLGAEIRDGAGRLTVGTPNNPCTPAYKLENEIGPDGVARAWIDGDTVHFGPPPPGTPGATGRFGRQLVAKRPSVFSGKGPFSVSVYCRENPKITSAGNNESPYNFETSDSRFASSNAPPAPAAPAPAAAATATAAGKPGAGAVLGGVLLGGAIILGAVAIAGQVEPETGGSSCPTAADVGRCDTTACIPANCPCPEGFIQTGTDNGSRCGSPAGQKFCSCTTNATATKSQPTVREFVARGFAHRADVRTPIRSTTVIGYRPNAIERSSPPARRRASRADILELKVRPPIPIAPRSPPSVRSSIAPARAPISRPRIDTTEPSKPRFSALLNAASVVQLFVARYLGTSNHAGVELTPWAQPDAGGVTLLKRF